MDKGRFLSSGLLEQYVLGLTSPEENKEVEEYLEAFPELRKEADAMRKAIENYAIQYSVPPPSRPKSENPSEISQSVPHKGRQNARNAPKWLLPLLTSILFTFASISIFFYLRLQQKQQAFLHLNAEFALFRKSCEEKELELKRATGQYAFFSHVATRPILLSGTELAPDAQAVVFWNDQTRIAYCKNLSLPVPPLGKHYQLWADVDGLMIEIGLLPKKGSGLYPVHFINGALSLNITLEPLYVNGKM